MPDSAATLMLPSVYSVYHGRYQYRIMERPGKLGKVRKPGRLASPDEEEATQGLWWPRENTLLAASPHGPRQGDSPSTSGSFRERKAIVPSPCAQCKRNASNPALGGPLPFHSC